MQLLNGEEKMRKGTAVSRRHPERREGQPQPVARQKGQAHASDHSTTAQTLTVHGVAALLGRSPDWVYRNWKQLVGGEKFPPPILPDGELTWLRHHVLAWLDRNLSAELRRQVAVVRIAEIALLSRPDPGDGNFVAEASERIRLRLSHSNSND